MKRLPAILILCCAFPLLLPADEDTLQLQQALKTQGFYYGDLNGTPGEETTQAIRRFQIRNALPVTGTLDADTRRAIGVGGDAPAQAPATAAEPPSPASPAPQTMLPPNLGQGPVASPPAGSRPDLRADPVPPAPGQRNPGSSIPDAPLTDGDASYRKGSTIFKGGPYADAPPFVQSSVIGQAQVRLAREGFYNGPPDSLPNQGTAEALLEYQAAYKLPRTGRLDANTVRALGLAPVAEARPPRQAKFPRPKYYEPPAPRKQDPGVYEGRIVPETAPR